ncbi:MAG: hypothetical protein EOP53_09815 [Sphingobacteriales bacterium]|nr:MAG: hypothetical protein EOP53_09815 [Sphingobacteriales bacterium]
MNAFLKFHSSADNDNSLSSNIQSGLSMLREGLNNAIDKTGDCIGNIVTPVNNFLKDFTQIDHEFKQVQQAEHEFRICLNGRFVTASDVLQMPMEENY